MVLPVAIPAMSAMLAPVVLPRLLRAWTALLPSSLAWFSARREALHVLTSSISVESSLALAAGILASFYSMMGLLERYFERYELPVGSGFGLDYRLACVMFGGPVALAIVGACANAVLALRTHDHDAAFMVVLGSTPATAIASAVIEAAIHVGTAVLAAAELMPALRALAGVPIRILLLDE